MFKVMKKQLEKMQSEYQDLVAPFGSEEIDDLKGLISRKKFARYRIREELKLNLSKRSDKK